MLPSNCLLRKHFVCTVYCAVFKVHYNPEVFLLGRLRVSCFALRDSGEVFLLGRLRVSGFVLRDLSLASQPYLILAFGVYIIHANSIEINMHIIIFLSHILSYAVFVFPF
jgi:hypothetical protein